jgi:hypothetical protein
VLARQGRATSPDEPELGCDTGRSAAGTGYRTTHAAMIRYFEEIYLLRAVRGRHFVKAGASENCQVSDEHQRHRGRNCILDLRIRL